MSDRGKQVADADKLGFNSFFVTSHYCVEQALFSLSKKRETVTPGFMNEVMFFMVTVIPTSLSIFAFSDAVRSHAAPELFQYHPIS